MDTHASTTNLPDSAEAGAHAPHGEVEHAHPTWSTYWKVATILFFITVAEVWAYYIPSFVASRAFVPTLLSSSTHLPRSERTPVVRRQSRRSSGRRPGLRGANRPPERRTSPSRIDRGGAPLGARGV